MKTGLTVDKLRAAKRLIDERVMDSASLAIIAYNDRDPYIEDYLSRIEGYCKAVVTISHRDPVYVAAEIWRAECLWLLAKVREITVQQEESP